MKYTPKHLSELRAWDALSPTKGIMADITDHLAPFTVWYKDAEDPYTTYTKEVIPVHSTARSSARCPNCVGHEIGANNLCWALPPCSTQFFVDNNDEGRAKYIALKLTGKL